MTDEAADARPTARPGKLRRRAWRLYSWGSRARWISTLFATRGDVAATLGALGLIGGVAATTVIEAVTPRGADPVRTTATTQRIDGHATLYDIEGRDEAGRRGAFELVVLDKTFDWKRGSTTELVKDGKVLSAAEIASDVLSPEVRRRLANAREVIVIGTASQEGDIAAETHRAGLRARQAAEWIAPAVPPSITVFTLNLGQYRNPCADCETGDTSWQRPFIVIAVRDRDPGVDTGQALAAAMTGKANLPSLSAYSTFGLTRHR